MGEGLFSKMSRDIFLAKNDLFIDYEDILGQFQALKMSKIICQVTPRGGSASVTHGGGGSKIGQKMSRVISIAPSTINSVWPRSNSNA
jgi:hypothetical protein